MVSNVSYGKLHGFLLRCKLPGHFSLNTNIADRYKLMLGARRNLPGGCVRHLFVSTSIVNCEVFPSKPPANIHLFKVSSAEIVDDPSSSHCSPESMFPTLCLQETWSPIVLAPAWLTSRERMRACAASCMVILIVRSPPWPRALTVDETGH